MTSAYPKQLDELVAQARRLCRDLGTIPSQNKLKAALHVRSERARSVLQILRTSGFDPARPDAEPTIAGTLPVELVPTDPEPVPEPSSAEPQVGPAGKPVPMPHRRWPLMLLAAPAFVAIWSGWVGVGALTGFGPVHPLPGIAGGFTINSAITLPIGVETYAAYALRVWLAGGGPARARRFAKRSAIAAFLLGCLGQVAYHLMTAAHLTVAPWPITTAVSCLPVVVLGFGAALAHLQRTDDRTEVDR